MEFKFFVFATVTAIHYSVKHTTRQDCNITLSKGGFYLRFFPSRFLSRSRSLIRRSSHSPRQHVYDLTLLSQCRRDHVLNHVRRTHTSHTKTHCATNSNDRALGRQCKVDEGFWVRLRLCPCVCGGMMPCWLGDIVGSINNVV